MGLGKNKPRGGGRSVGSGEQSTSNDRSVSPVVGIILLFGMVFVGAAVVATAGMMLVDDLQSASNSEQGEQVMQQIGHDIASEEQGIHLANNGDYNISQQGKFTLNVSNQFGRTCEMSDVSLGTLQYQNANDETVAYQAGGVFVKSESSTIVRSNPDISYIIEERNGERIRYLDLSLKNLSGSASQGTHKANYQPEKPDTSCFENIRFASNITVTVADTPYVDGWESFLEDEFNTTAVKTGQKVSVTAKLDQKRPFASFANIDPTIYGGIYTGDDITINSDLEIDRYNGSVGWNPGSVNKTEDMLVTDGDINLHNNAEVTGMPVAAGELTANPNAALSSIGYASEYDPPAKLYETVNEGQWNETEVYNINPSNSSPEIFGAKMNLSSSNSIDGVNNIDSEIIGATEQLDAYPNSKSVSATLDVKNGNETVYYAPGGVNGIINKIDTSGGVVHLAIDGDLENADFEVTGEGQAYIYVNGSSIDIEDIRINDHERANALWIHGKKDAVVEVEDEFQGVLYAPESEITLNDDATIFGAMVGGNYVLGDDVNVHFDKTLRTDIPIPDQNKDIALDYIKTRFSYDVTFALDRSGSMGCSGLGCFFDPGNDPDGLRIEATKNFIGKLNSSNDRAGAIEFDDETEKLHELTSNFTSLNESLEANVEGQTDIGGGIEAAANLYDVNPDSEKIMILMTDGQNQVTGHTEEELNNLTRENAKNAFKNQSVTIHTVGLGDNLNETLLKGVANITGGEYHHVSDAEDLSQIFEGIAASLPSSAASTIEASTFEETTEWSNEHVISIRQSRIEIEPN